MFCCGAVRRLAAPQSAARVGLRRERKALVDAFIVPHAFPYALHRIAVRHDAAWYRMLIIALGVNIP